MSNTDAQYVIRAQDAMTRPQDSRNDIPRLGPWTLDVRRGDFVAVTGPRGCGKTSLIKLLAGLLPLAGGHLERSEPVPGVVFGKPCLMPWRSVMENVIVGAELKKAAMPAAKERARLLLGSLGGAEYADRHEPGLSPGIAERAAVCRALVHKPTLLLMDNPFRSVDPLDREQLWLDLQRLWAEEGFAAILTTTDIAEAVHLADRVVVMGQAAGEIVKMVPIELPRPRRMSKTMTPLLAEYSDIVRTALRAQGALP